MAKPKNTYVNLLDEKFSDIRLEHMYTGRGAEINIVAGCDDIGKGTYGRVFKVEFNGAACVARELHPGLSLKGNNCEDQYLSNCRKYRNLHHPNIVQFFGVVCTKPNNPPIQVMEKMHCSLTSFIESSSDIPTSTKLSILHDVAAGLNHLHCHRDSCRKPQSIVHCYLSSNNVLLTSTDVQQLKAKISDVGLAQMVRGRKSTSKSMIFMAPELMESKSKSMNDADPSADVFSYGVVMLHTVSQQWPEPTSICQEREQSSIDHDDLNNLMGSCLEENPRNRPIVTDVLTRLKAFTTSPAAFRVLEQNEPDEVVELPNQIKESVKDKIVGLDRVQNNLEEILKVTKEYKKNFEETLQDVEQLEAKHQQKVKQLEEDKANQATKFALESKSNNDKIEELKTASKRNDAINKAKVNELEGRINMQNTTITQQETKVEELELALKEREDSIQAAEVEHQQTLDQQKAKVTAVEKEKIQLQDTVTEKNEALQKSEERNQQLLEELEQYKASAKAIDAEIEKLKNAKREVEGSRQATETERQKPLEQHKKQDEQNSHHSRCGSQSVDDKQKDNDGSQNNNERQRDKPQEDDGEQEYLAKNDLEKQKEKQKNDNHLSRKDQESQQIDGEYCTKIKAIKPGLVNTQKESDTTGED